MKGLRPSWTAARVRHAFMRLVHRVGMEMTAMAVGTSQKMATVGVVSVANPNPPTAFKPEPTNAEQKTRMKTRGLKITPLKRTCAPGEMRLKAYLEGVDGSSCEVRKGGSEP